MRQHQNFQKNLKLFASIDNLPEKYDTIEVNNRLTVFGIRLPISICTDYAVPYTVRYITLTDDEAYAVAQSKLYEQIYDTLGDAEIISTSEDVTSDGNVLTLTAVVDCVCEIADEVKINTVK
ncbi:MAG: sporulation protein YqfD [Clostridia bacterium]|nr:sporulation protein YqfD [Clostridia bacterium]